MLRSPPKKVARLTFSLLEANSLGGKLINMRRRLPRIPVTTQMVGPTGVDADQQYVANPVF